MAWRGTLGHTKDITVEPTASGAHRAQPAAAVDRRPNVDDGWWRVNGDRSIHHGRWGSGYNAIGVYADTYLDPGPGRRTALSASPATETINGILARASPRFERRHSSHPLRLRGPCFLCAGQ